jgi:hypothetical protein
VFGVRAQLGAGRVDARPVGPLLERVLIAEGRDVDRDARIVVPAPGAAEGVAGLDDLVVADPRLVEVDRSADAGEAGADDQDFVVKFGAGDARILR